MMVFFVLAQFFVLVTVGTKGAEIGNIRSQMDELRTNNEYLRAEIDKAKTLGQIEQGLDSVYDLRQVNIESLNAVELEPDSSTASAI